jgi:hypothetical protein
MSSDFIRTVSTWLEGLRKLKFATAVKYSRVGHADVDLVATVGRTVFTVDQGGFVGLKVESRDYIITAADLGFEPEPGHKITEDGRVYQVLSINNAPCYSYSDPGRTTMRIHTKAIT